MSEKSKPSREAMRTLPHLMRETSPLQHGYEPFHITVSRPESPNARLKLSERMGFKYSQREEEVIVWAKNIPDITNTLNYHYGRSWGDITIVEDQERRKERSDRERD